MWRWTIHNLLDDRGRLVVSVSGVAAALVLVLLLDGVFAGTSEQIVAYPRQTDADVWVMQDGVSNMHMATSIVPDDREAAVRAVSGVSDVTPILYVNNFVEAGGRKWFSYVVGLTPTAGRGGPWAMARGVRMPERGEAIVPEIIAREAGLDIGDSVIIMGRGLRIAGLTRETFSLANSVTWVHAADLAVLMAAGNSASYLLVKAEPGISARDLAARIDARVSGVHAMTRDAFVTSDRALALQMGADIIRVMTFVGFAVGVLIIGFTVYTATMRRRRELAVTKALGARNGQLLGAIVAQTMLVTAGAFAVALGLAYAVQPLIEWLVPEVAVLYPAASVAKLAVAASAIGVVASWIPSRRVMRIDPGLVFRE